MPDVGVACETARLFVYGSCGDSLNRAAAGKLARLEYPLHGRLARNRRHLAVLDRGVVEVLQVEHIDVSMLADNIVNRVRDLRCAGSSYQLKRSVHRGGAAHNERASLLIHPLVLKRLRGDFRADARRIAHRNRKQWPFAHINTSKNNLHEWTGYTEFSSCA